ncbi:MAG TPA: glycosyltransferase family 1 protein, partial [Anaerolineae bacterium]
AITFDPLNTDQLVAALERIVTDEALRSDLRQRGLARASQFTWTTTAAQLMQALGAHSATR